MNRCYAWADWYYRHFLRGLCYYFPLLLLLLGPVTFIRGVPDAFGASYQVLHEDLDKGLAIGFALALYQMMVLFVSYLIWRRDLREGRLLLTKGETAKLESDDRGAHEAVSFPGYVIRVLACVVGTMVVGCGLMLAGDAILPFVPVSSDARPTQEEEPASQDVSSATPGEEESPSYGWRLTYLLSGFALGIVSLSLLVHLAHSRLKHWPAPPATPTEEKATDVSDQPAAKATPWAKLWCGMLLVCWGGANIFLVLSAARDPRPISWAGPIVLGVLGFGLTLGGVCWTRWQTRLVLPAGMANLTLLYATTTYVISRCPLGALAAVVVAACGVVLLYLVFREHFPTQLHWVRAQFHKALPPATDSGQPPEREYLAWGAICLGLPIVLLALAEWVGWFGTPLVWALGALSGLVALYGLFAYLLRRGLFVVIVMGLLFAAFSHLQAFKIRFPSLTEKELYRDRDSLVQLDSLLKKDVANQKVFDELLKSYDDAVIGKEDTTELTHRLVKQWLQMNQSNRVRAGQFLHSARYDDLTDALEKADRKNLSENLIVPARLQIHPLCDPGATKERKLIVVAVSGGGIRSAVWTFAVLAELEKQFAQKGIDFPAHVRFIAGASGGMVGAAYYTAALPAPPDDCQTPRYNAERGTLLEHQREAMAKDFLTPLVRRAVLTDLPSWISPWPLAYDRGRALEDGWSQHLKIDPKDANSKSPMDSTFEDLRQGELEGWRPSLIFTPMTIEDGRRLVISNLDLRYPISNTGWVLTSNGETDFRTNHSVDGMELFRLIPEARKNLLLGTAARMNASFPYFSPAVSLPTIPRRRVVDAGYYDNFGISIAASWLQSRENNRWMDANRITKVLVVQIRAGADEAEMQYLKVPPVSASPPDRSLEGLLSPPEALYTGRFASSRFLNDGQLELLGHWKRERRVGKQGIGQPPARQDVPSVARAYLEPAKASEASLLVVNFELPARVSTSWSLTRTEKTAIRKQAVTKVQERFSEVTQWWNQPVPTPLRDENDFGLRYTADLKQRVNITSVVSNAGASQMGFRRGDTVLSAKVGGVEKPVASWGDVQAVLEALRQAPAQGETYEFRVKPAQQDAQEVRLKGRVQPIIEGKGKLAVIPEENKRK